MLKFFFSKTNEKLDEIDIHFSIPLAIVNKAHQANQTYPFAVSLIESVRAYDRTLEKVCNSCQHALNVTAICLWPFLSRFAFFPVSIFVGLACIGVQHQHILRINLLVFALL